MAQAFGMPFFETSAKQSVNIDVIFQAIGKEIMGRLGESLKISQVGVKLQVDNRRKAPLKKKDDLDIENCCS